MQFGQLVEGRLVRRYKRFLADVLLPGGDIVTVHCPNTGAMTGCAEPDAPVWLSVSPSPSRKHPHTWELVATSRGIACIHSAKANTVVREAFAAGKVPGFEAYPEIRPEVRYGRGSRADLLLSGGEGRAFVEIKSVTLCRGDGVGLFPDAVSVRGRRHLEELQSVLDQRTRALLVFCVMHAGIETVSAAGEIDPQYREALGAAIAAGVEVLAFATEISPAGVELARPLPFCLDPAC